MAIYGAVVLHGKPLEDDELATIDPKQRLLYGIDWVYDGDQFFNESNICADGHVFGGRTGLPDFLKYYNATR